MEVLITSHVKVCLGNDCNHFIHTARNPKVTCNRNGYKKLVIERKKEGFQRRIENPFYNEAF